MQYHKAAFLGQERSRKAQMKLFEYTGFSMLTYTIKKGSSGFEPVGEEMLVGNLNNGREIIIFICDNDGYAKAQSKSMTIDEGNKIVKKMVFDGFIKFDGEIKTVI
ncbi:MAG TPA: hypothetical protein VEW92_07660 [Nitrososphaeraceae archaeon]|jgi:hypothetical protein|nr:hypothetical protein [Nitrososphaeraceae archaeon]